jgi:hypothetical protein
MNRKFYIMNLDSNIKITYYWVCNRFFFSISWYKKFEKNYFNLLYVCVCVCVLFIY